MQRAHTLIASEPLDGHVLMFSEPGSEHWPWDPSRNKGAILGVEARITLATIQGLGRCGGCESVMATMPAQKYGGTLLLIRSSCAERNAEGGLARPDAMFE